MDARTMKKLVDQARADPKFFHDLVFNPESVLGKLGDLDRSARASLVAVTPEEVIGRLIGEVAWCDVTCTSSCGATCNQSCGYTTNYQGFSPEETVAGRFQKLAGCDVTCTSSCGATCTGSSCGYTTNLTDMGQIVQRGGRGIW